MTNPRHHLHRTRHGGRYRNKVNRRSLTFVMIELADAADCNARRNLWRGSLYRYRDVTPLFKSLKSVPSLFNGRYQNKGWKKKGEQMLRETEDVVADWYMLSGHHGRMYANDHYTQGFRQPDGSRITYAVFWSYDRSEWFRDRYGGKNAIDLLKYTGFFNNDYHHGRWSKVGKMASKTSRHNIDWKPTSKALKRHEHYEVFLTTSTQPLATDAPFDTKNPILKSAKKSKRNKRCKGIIISACNTLTYKSARVQWHDYYPDAVIIGTWGRIGRGTWLINAIRRTRQCNRAFWEKPSLVLGEKNERVEQFVIALAKNFKRGYENIPGLLYKDYCYGALPDATGKLKVWKGKYDFNWPPKI